MTCDLFGGFGAPKEMRPHQSRLIEAVRQSFLNGNYRVIAASPTGSGKTITAANIIRSALERGKRVAFCVPALSLIDQTVEAFEAEGIDSIGVIQSTHPRLDPDAQVQVCSVQTLASWTTGRKNKDTGEWKTEPKPFPDVGLVIVDEAHIQHAVTYRWMDREPTLRFVGLTATPWTRGLGQRWDDLVVAATTRELIDAGYLSDYTIFAPSHPDLRGVKTTAGDYNQEQLSKVMQDGKLVGDVVESWLKLGNSEPTLVFAVDRAHAKKLQERFEQAGVRMGYCDAFTDRIERHLLFDQMARGEIAGIVNVGTLTTGVDRDVRTLVLARPTKSEALFVQIIGRALRTAPGKAQATIIDHTDTTLRLGLPCSITSDCLDDGARGQGQSQKRKTKQSEDLPTSCPSCDAVKPPKVRECPSCGFTPAHVRDIEARPGELAAVKAGKGRVYTRAEKQRFLSGLIHVAQERGRSRGWISHTYRDRHGVWPQGLEWIPCEPTVEVRNFVKFKDIQFAKSRRRETAHAS